MLVKILQKRNKTIIPPISDYLSDIINDDAVTP
jgi:hypothetical protein